MNIEIKTTGIKELEGKIAVLQNKLDTGNPSGTLHAVMQRSLYRLVIGLAQYPARKSKWYERTGTLGRKWTTKIHSGNPMVGVVGNDAQSPKTGEKYAPRVQSHIYQMVSARRMGWNTDMQILDKNREIIIHEFQNAIGSAVTVTFGVSTGGPD